MTLNKMKKKKNIIETLRKKKFIFLLRNQEKIKIYNIIRNLNRFIQQNNFIFFSHNSLDSLSN